MKQSLVGKPLNELALIFESLGEKPFRAKQLYEWIYTKNARSFSEITPFSKALREKLDQSYCVETLSVADLSDVGDAYKYLFRLHDGQYVESVLMPSDNRMTLCISCQVGCAVDCQFCATGKMGFKRHLTVGEILEQVIYINREIETRISNIVFMGMGEPFLNYDNVISSAEVLNDPNAFGIGVRKITISTSGIIPKIYQFADENQPYRLAISLNDVDQARREASMPITKKYTIEELLKAASYYTQKTQNRITFEYVMIKDQNISKEDADLLRKLIHHIDCKINLIPCNSRDDAFLRPSEEEAELFKHRVEKSKPAFIRKTRGRSIDAACGMLHNKFIEKLTEMGAPLT